MNRHLNGKSTPTSISPNYENLLTKWICKESKSAPNEDILQKMEKYFFIKFRIFLIDRIV